MQTAYTAANDTYDRFLLRRRKAGLWIAWHELGHELRSARDTFWAVGHDPRLPRETRAIALMNGANALSTVGRHFEALDTYEHAAKLRPDDGMVRGNRGVELYTLALGLRQSHSLLVGRAREDLAFAVQAEHLDGNAGAIFKQCLDRLSHHADEPVEARIREYEDPYSRWAYEQNLLLSASLGAMPPEDQLDTASATGLVTKLEAFSTDDSPVPPALSAINAIKRDYLTARLMAYLATQRPPEVKLGARSRSARYVDTLDYAFWDLPTGLAASSYASALNLADKMATFVAFWLTLPHEHVNDRNWAFVPVRRASRGSSGSAPLCGPVRPQLETIMRDNAGKLTGLLGLIDLAQEEAESISRQSRRDVRDAAVHQFLSVRMFMRDKPSDFIHAVRQDELQTDLITALRQVRRMFLQIILAVGQKGRLDAGDRTMPMTMTDYENPMTSGEP